MNSTLAAELNLRESLFQLARDLEALALQAHRPRLKDIEWRRRFQQACDDLSARAQSARQALTEAYESIGPALDDATRCLKAYSTELASGAPKAMLRTKAQTLSETYEEFRRRMKGVAGGRSFIHAPRLERMKPVNYRRNLFHVGMGLGAAGMYEFVLTQAQATIVMAILLGIAVSFEVTRRVFPAWNRVLTRLVFRDVIRPWEKRRPNSASWYTLALMLIAALTPKLAAQIGVLVLAFGDPAASILGRKFGRVKLYRRKSIIGTSAFAGMAAIVTATMALLKGAPLSPWALFGMCATVAVASAAAELFSDVVDDNATVPITAACIATMWLGA